MDKKKRLEMEKILSAFHYRDLQNFVTILIVLERQDKEIEDVIAYVAFLMVKQKAHEAENAIVYQKRLVEALSEDELKTGRGVPQRVCPKCEMQMVGFSVNTTRCNQVGENLKTQWICPKCDIEEYV